MLRQPGAKYRNEARTEAAFIYPRECPLPVEVSVQPIVEIEQVADPHLTGMGAEALGLDPVGRRLCIGLRLLAGPLSCLVSAPRRGKSAEREEQHRGEL